MRTDPGDRPNPTQAGGVCRPGRKSVDGTFHPNRPPVDETCRPRRMGRRTTRWLGALAILSLLVMFGNILYELDRRQWDLRSFHAAAQLVSQGGNPYDFDTLQAQESDPSWPYVYPLGVAMILRPLAATDYYPLSPLVWAALKAGALLMLLALWRRTLAPTLDGGSFLLLSLVGVQGAVLLDVRSGNVEIFQNLFLWSGLILALRRRYVPGALLVGLAGGAKLVLVAFLALFAMSGAWVATLAGLGVFIAVAAGPFLFRPDLAPAFLESLLTAPRAGAMDLSLLSTLRFVENSRGLDLHADVIWMVSIALALTAGAVAIRRHAGHPLLVLEAMTLVYVACLPRMIAYSGIVLVAPLLLRGERRGYSLPVLLLLTLPGLSQLPEIPAFTFPVPWSLVGLVLLFLLARESPGGARTRDGEPVEGAG